LKFLFFSSGRFGFNQPIDNDARDRSSTPSKSHKQVHMVMESITKKMGPIKAKKDNRYWRYEYWISGKISEGPY